MNNNMYGTLNDEEIRNLVNNGQLIIENFDDRNIKQACYELRAGCVYFDLSAGGEQHKVEEGEPIVFKPRQTIVIISKEKIKIPADFIARFITKGSLFSVGFTPINTYADPGFEGNMGFVMNNASNNYLKITSGEVIAKVEFDRLQKPVSKAYHGQHGFETGVWPIRQDFIIKSKDFYKYFGDYDDISIIKDIYGEPVANILKRIVITERRFLFATIILILVNLCIIGISVGTKWLDPISSVSLGIIANFIYSVASIVINSFRKGRNSKE